MKAAGYIWEKQMKLNYKGCNEREKIVKAIFGVRRTMEPGGNGTNGDKSKV